MPPRRSTRNRPASPPASNYISSMLPPEILSPIFIQALFLFLDEERSDPTGFLNWLTSQTSYWRHVALATPRLWSCHWSGWTLEHQHTYLRRSKNQPLHLHVIFPWLDEQPFDVDWDQSLYLIRANLFRSIYVYDVGSSDATTFVNNFIRQPHLDNLELILLDAGRDHGESLPFTFPTNILTRAPRLNTIKLFYAHWTNFNAITGRLRHVMLKNSTQPPEQLVEILDTSQVTLESLELSEESEPWLNIELMHQVKNMSARWVMRTLKILLIGAECSIEPHMILMDHTSLPSLEALSITQPAVSRNPSRNMPFMTYTTALDRLIATAPKLEVFELIGVQEFISAVLNTLCTLAHPIPSLRHLILHVVNPHRPGEFELDHEPWLPAINNTQSFSEPIQNFVLGQLAPGLVQISISTDDDNDEVQPDPWGGRNARRATWMRMQLAFNNSRLKTRISLDKRGYDRLLPVAYQEYTRDASREDSPASRAATPRNLDEEVPEWF